VTVYAAGVICWREAGKDIEVLLVHREQYDDWGFPKGKQDKGELLQETAVREVEEEAGIKVRLGRKLDVIHYKVGKGEDKYVSYWASKVPHKIYSKSRFKPNKEIARVEWHELQVAKKMLSYAHDRSLLEKLIEFHNLGQLETRSLIVLRHAKATPRTEWSNGEATRPLLPEGELQAKRLVKLLKSYGPRRLITSPWRRCHDTVVPYAKSSKRKLVKRSQITEFKSKKNPKQARQLMEDLFKDSKNALVCTHRPALPEVLEAVSQHASGGMAEPIRQASSLSPSDFLVVRLSLEKTPKVLDYELVSLGEKR
jgi:8-oxo-dGTP diphosphatase